MKLYILNGPDKGRSFELKNDTIRVGRSPDNDIQMRDVAISREHLKITKKRNKFFIEDLGSKNGTFLNRKRIRPVREIEVKKGTAINIGNIFFSLGKPYTGDLQTVRDSIDEVDDSIKTRTLEISRYMTSPKNLELLYKVSNVLMQSLDIKEILEKILDHIFDLLKRIDRGVIILRDPETEKILETISRGVKEGTETMTMKTHSSTIVHRVMREGKPIVMLDTRAADDSERSESMEIMKIRSAMCVPLISKSQIRGVIYVDSTKTHGFRKGDLSLLTALSSPAAVAIENALLYSNLEQMVEKRTKELRKTEKRLRESDTRFKAMFEKMSSGVVVYKAASDGKDFVVIDSNKADEKIEKFKKSEKIGKSLLQASPGFKRMNQALLETLKRVRETGMPERRTITLMRKEKISASRDYFVYRLPSGEIVAIYDDVTDKKKAEAEQKALQEQLFRSQKMESIGAFAGGTAHNFRNILQTISGNIEYLEMLYAEKPEIKELANSVHDSVEKGVELINNLLHFSKRDGKYDLEYLDLADVISDTYQIIDRVFDKNIIIELSLENDLLVKGNQALLGQVFMNLFTNARDAMPDGGKLRIGAKKTGNKVVSIVSDTGHGMDKETLGKIFDPFFTLKEVGKGTGLGLSTTHGIVEQHNGTISVRSTPRKGTAFTIRFPLEKGVSVTKPKPSKEPLKGDGQRVLIIDDERPTLEALSNLAKTLGYEAISIDTPLEALKNYAKWSPDAVLIDRNMPVMDGGSCIKEIAKIDPKAKIIIVSGYEKTGPDGIDEDVKRLITGYLTKPFRIDELSQTLSKALGTKSSQ
jgi:signal transduction histidine kinase/ActR/RegA family two-component response regulator